jgi:hypothetical protein
VITYLIGTACGLVLGTAATVGATGGLRLLNGRRSDERVSGLATAVETLVERVNQQDQLLAKLNGELTNHLADVVLRFDGIDQAMAGLIRREEVEAAFAEVAKLEARRAHAAAQVPMPPAGFVMGQARAPRPAQTAAAAEMNLQINEQLAALNARLGDLGEQFGRF